MVLLSWKTRKGKSKRNFGWKFWGRGLEKRGFCRKSCRNLHKGSLEYLFKAGQRMTRRWIIHRLHMGLRNVQILTNLIPWGIEKTPHKGPAQPVEPNCAAYVLSHFTCLILCNPMDCGLQPPLFMGFSRQEYWSLVAMSSSRLSSWSGDWICNSRVANGFFMAEPPANPRTKLSLEKWKV